MKTKPKSIKPQKNESNKVKELSDETIDPKNNSYYIVNLIVKSK